MKQLFPGIWQKGKQLLTKNLVPGFRSYTETLTKIKGVEYRIWDPTRSKASAAIVKGLETFPLKAGIKILYLGVAQGYTSSFFSDIVGKDGIVYGIEISGRAIRELTSVAEKRGNIVPILADARKPQDYTWIEPVDIVYQDVAIPDQSEILIRNANIFLKPTGFAMIAIKARSIDVVRPPQQIYKEELKKLSEHFTILDKKELSPYEKDHMFAVMKPKA